MDVRYAVEGPTDEPLAKRLIEAVDMKPKATFIARGKSKLDPRLPGYNAAGRHSAWLVLRDLDHDDAGSCVPALVQSLLGGSPKRNVLPHSGPRSRGMAARGFRWLRQILQRDQGNRSTKRRDVAQPEGVACQYVQALAESDGSRGHGPAARQWSEGGRELCRSRTSVRCRGVGTATRTKGCSKLGASNARARPAEVGSVVNEASLTRWRWPLAHPEKQEIRVADPSMSARSSRSAIRCVLAEGGTVESGAPTPLRLNGGRYISALPSAW